MIDPDDIAFIKAFVARVDESRLSAEDVSKRAGGKPSGPTILRYKRKIYPKERLDQETRRGINLFMTGHNSSTDAAERPEYDRHLEWLREQAGDLDSKTAHLREVRGWTRDESLRLLAVAVLRAEDNAAMLSQERSGHRDAILRGDEEQIVSPEAASSVLSAAGTVKNRSRTAEAPAADGDEKPAQTGHP